MAKVNASFPASPALGGAEAPAGIPHRRGQAVHRAINDTAVKNRLATRAATISGANPATR